MQPKILQEVEQGTIEWLEARKKGIGGSDAATVLGLNPYKTPYELYLEKVGETGGIQDNKYMKWGRALEPVIRQEYSDRTGRQVKIPKGILQHSKYEFMICSLDGWTEDNRIQEFKTASANNATQWGEDGSDQIPEPYRIQVEHNLIVSGFEIADVAVLIAGNDYRQYEIRGDKELQQMIIDAEASFWHNVETRTEPEAITLQDAQRKYKSGVGAFEVTENILQIIENLKAIKEEYQRLEEEKISRENEIKKFILEKGVDTLTHKGRILLTWKEGKGRESIDKDAIKIAYPDIYREFVKIGNPVRTFLVK